MTYFFIPFVILLLLYGVYIYNKLIRLRNMAHEAWSGIDVQLRKRYDLIPNIVETVKHYAKHEKQLFESITQLRQAGKQAHSVKEQETAEIGLAKSLGSLFVVVENYPELQANQNFLDLQKQLASVEHDLQHARRYYNGSVRNYNTFIEQFPSNLIAALFNHTQQEYFDLDNETEGAVPQISLTNPE